MEELQNKKILVFLDIYNSKYKETLEVLISRSIANYRYNSDFFTYAEYVKYKNIFISNYKKIKKSFTIVHPNYFNSNNYNINDFDYVIGLGKTCSEFVGIEGTSDETVGNTYNVVLKGKTIPYYVLPSVYIVNELYRRLENNSNDPVAKRRLCSMFQVGVNRAHGYEPLSTKTNVKFIQTAEDCQALVNNVFKTKIFAFDFETIPIVSGLDSSTSKKHAVDFTKSLPTCCSFSEHIGKAWLLPMFHAQSPFLVGQHTEIKIFKIDNEVSKQISHEEFRALDFGEYYIAKNNSFVVSYDYDLFKWTWEEVNALLNNYSVCKEFKYDNYLVDKIIPILTPIFDAGDIIKIAYNFKFDFKIACALGWRIKSGAEDPMMMFSTMDEVSAKSLKIIGTYYFPEFQGYGEHVDYFNDDLNTLGIYAATDTDLTLRLYYILKYELCKVSKLFNGYYSHEVPKLIDLGELEYEGMYVNHKDLLKLTKSTKELHDKLEKELNEFDLVKSYTSLKKFNSINELLTEYQERLEKTYQRTLNGIKKKILDLHNDPKRPTSKAKTRDYKHYKQQLKIAEARDFYNSNYPYAQAGKLTREIKVLNSLEEIKNGKHKDIFQAVNFNSSSQVAEIIYKTELQKQIPKLSRSIRRQLNKIVDNPTERAKLEKQLKYYEIVDSIGLKNEWPIVTRKLVHKITKRKRSVTEAYPSTNKNELYDLTDDTGFLDKYLEFKAISKLLSTYLIGMAKFIDSKGRVHTSYGTVDTKRLSSRNPNLQNLPSRSIIESVKKIVKGIKKCIQASKGRIIAQIDLSQAELRIYSLLGGIISMQQAYLDDEDIHVKTACAILGISQEEFYKLPKDEYKLKRTWAKAANFGIIYKISPEGFQKFAKISYGIKLSLKEAKEWMARFFELYPEIHNYHKEQIALARKQGYVETLYGFRRHLPNIHSLSSEYRSKDERISINSPTQGTGGQMLVQSMMIAKQRLHAYGYTGKYRFLNTVHDSIILEADTEHAGHIFKIVMDACNNAPNKEYFNRDLCPVPMKSDIEFSKNSWGELVEFGEKGYKYYDKQGNELKISGTPEELLAVDFSRVTW